VAAAGVHLCCQERSVRLYFMYAATFFIFAVGCVWIVKGSKNPGFKRWMPVAFMIAGIIAVIILAALLPR
jgi:hypothetical protein